MEQPVDKLGQTIQVGDYIAYGHALGRCAGLRVGIVLAIKEVTVSWNPKKKSIHFTVRGIEDDWSSYKPKLCNKKGTLQFANRIVVLDPEIVPLNYKELLDSAKNRRAIFFDRDGVLVKPIIRDGKPCAPLNFDEFKVVSEAPYVCSKLDIAGFDLFVVSNQPDVARGKLDPEILRKMNVYLKSILLLKDILTCIHDDEDDCLCRKPKPGMIDVLAELYGIDKSKSYMIGDTWKDAGAAQAAGVPMIMIRKTYNFFDRLADHFIGYTDFRYKSVWSLEGAANWIIKQAR